MDMTPYDPKGLIADSYQIEGIQPSECRSIFFDWALSLPEGVEAREALQVLLSMHGAAHPDHPMTAVLTEGRVQMQSPRRRGGWRGRTRN